MSHLCQFLSIPSREKYCSGFSSAQNNFSSYGISYKLKHTSCTLTCNAAIIWDFKYIYIYGIYLLLCLLIVISFSLLNSILRYEYLYTVDFLSTDQLMCTRDIYNVWLSWINLLWALLYNYLWICLFIFLW